jgi:hypothetical protein
MNPSAFDPAALFARLAGSYTLTFEADESCSLEPSLKVVTYDVSLGTTPFRYLAVLVPSHAFAGDLWALDRADQGFAFRWNVDCELPDTAGSTVFYLCGEGAAVTADNGTISGVFPGGNIYFDADHRPLCATSGHRFVFRRKR